MSVGSDGILSTEGEGDSSITYELVALSRVRVVRGVLYSPSVMDTYMDTWLRSGRVYWSSDLECLALCPQVPLLQRVILASTRLVPGV